MYNTMQELLDLANGRGCPLWQVIMDNENKLTDADEETIFAKLGKRYDIMLRSASRALEQPLSTVGGLIEGIASKHNAYAQGDSLCGGMINTLMARALSCSECNASMGIICAAPTAGACGIVPAVLITVSERYGLDRRQTLEGLLTASGIGAIITANATVSGAEGGCQAECGTAAAMAAAASVYMAGGDNNMAMNASSFALINCMGLVCDPVAGLVQIPCAQRNASQAVNAVISADMALGGMECIIPPDQVVEAMYNTGRLMPHQLRETALGGIAASRAGKAVQAKIFGEGD